MAVNSLRIISRNLIDASAVGASGSSSASAVYSFANAFSDVRGTIWRSATRTSGGVLANMRVTLPSSRTIAAVVLSFTNLTPAATIRVRGYTGTNPTLTGTVDTPTITTTGATLVFDTGFVLCCPYPTQAQNTFDPTGFSTTTYGLDKVYARVYVPIGSAACTSLTIEVSDSTNSVNYLECNRLIVTDSYWSPTYNTSYEGLGMTVNDTTTYQRSESGGIIPNNGIVYNSLNFNLSWLTGPDRAILADILRKNGKRRSLFISLFPENTGDYAAEQQYQLYGRLSNLSAISYPYLDIYGSSISIEEI